MRMRPLMAALLAITPHVHADPATLGEVTVTGTREGELLSGTPASVGLIKGEPIRQDKPSHPARIMSQVPGVHVSVTNGEGHATAIRQPITTSPVYLYLEDGVPTRSTGFFNHNALYEINVPAAAGIEVSKGSGSALYGSDAIGGVVNVLTRTPPAQREFTASGELGEHGWWRTLFGGGNGYAHGAWHGDLNLTHSDGWRDKTAYDRQAAGVRWDHGVGDGLVKTVLAYSRVDQETGASAPLTLACLDGFAHDLHAYLTTGLAPAGGGNLVSLEAARAARSA